MLAEFNYPLSRSVSSASSAPQGNPFVFSMRLDLLAFYIPLAVGVFVSHLPGDSTIQASVLFVAISVWFSDAGHVFGTMVPVALDRRTRLRFGQKIWLLPLLVLSFWFILSQAHKSFFGTLFGYFGLYHVVMQQYGWMKILLRKNTGSSKWEDRFDLLAFWNVYLVPIAYWHTGLSQVAKSYYFSNNLIISLPADVWSYLLPLHMAINFLFLGKILADRLKRGQTEWGKLFFIVYGWLWFYGGLVLATGGLYFWTVLGLTHGIAYHIYMNTYWRKSGTASMPKWFVKDSWFKFAGYILAITLISRMWILVKPSLDGASLLPIYWIMTMTHHAFDTVLWRKRSHHMAQAKP